MMSACNRCSLSSPSCSGRALPFQASTCPPLRHAGVRLSAWPMKPGSLLQKVQILTSLGMRGPQALLVLSMPFVAMLHSPCGAALHALYCMLQQTSFATCLSWQQSSLDNIGNECIYHTAPAGTQHDEVAQQKARAVHVGNSSIGSFRAGCRRRSFRGRGSCRQPLGSCADDCVPAGLLEIPAAPHNPRHHPRIHRRHCTRPHRVPRCALLTFLLQVM